MNPRRLSVIRLVWAHLWSRPGVTALNGLLLTLGFAAITLVLLVSEQAEHQFRKDLAGVDLVVGAKGSPLQLILSGIYHLDSPTGNIPATAADQLRAHPLVAQVVPLALGDSAQGFRIVGTTPDYLQLHQARLAAGQWRAQALQAVIGADVARRTGWRVGQRFEGSHGLGGGGPTHGDHPFTVAGVLAPTGGVIDRLILTPVESVWQVHDVHHPPAPAGGQADDHDHAHHPSHDDDEKAAPQPPRELTMLLVRYRSPLAAALLPRWVNSQGPLQAASPAQESVRLLGLVGVGIQVLQGFGAVLLFVAALSVFVALSHAVRDRQPELAMMRLLGASPRRVSATVAAEALTLAAIGVLAGMLLGHGLTHLLGHLLDGQASLRLTGLWWSPLEAWLPLVGLGLGGLACLGPTWLAYRTSMLPALQGHH